ncbi:NAD-dependent DNA ligase LigA [Buchnera aphidicola]|uniref:DNA ligase n=1 Tax=Buchnera aphidicola (Sarucallis kahawaluokalani) TaxID=1241878 RepID=A0A4D6Y888_9GAMM|nr:NAD-dependent DNA ligase LigA [Buchnera aphidicola]QCI25857.1 NAD-dependent DNA ligase LigA [Buchnera aphidicola (Sarucallis kahawaluokalani)]
MNVIKKKIFYLYKLLHYHDYLYHTLNMPIISDTEYDFLSNKLYILKNKYVQLYYVVKKTFFKSTRLNIIKKNSHFTRMLSLDHTFDINGYMKFHQNIRNRFNHLNINFFCEVKFDGVALNLLYRKGKLVRALTRGDGVSGEDVTKNAYVVNNIPLVLKGIKEIPELIEVRGEVCMLKKDFLQFNSIALKNNDKFFSNTRNAAAGSLRQKNISITKKRKLFFYCYGCNIISNFKEYETHSKQLNMLYNLGFSISPYILLSHKLNNILKFYYLMEKVRNFLSFNIDGIVVKVNSIARQNILGITNKFPKWAIAIKFLSKSEKTRLLNVEYQIGRTGLITPVAHLEPILISGVIIQKASLYNKNELDKLDLHIYDTVIVYRAGDVIPKIQSTVLHLRPKNAKKVIFPKYCPSCFSLLHIHHSNVIAQCLAGLNCLAQRIKIIGHFFSKDALYVENFSLGIITQLVLQKYIKIPLDCFQLTINLLSGLKYFGVKSATKIIFGLQKCKKTTLSRFIYALGIPEIGLENAEIIATYFGSLSNVLNCTLHQLKKIKNIGVICANYFFDFIRSKKNILYIMQLVQIGGIILSSDENKLFYNKNNVLFNKKIVVTGKFINFNRQQIIDKIVSFGGVIMKNISSKTNLLIVGSNPGNKVHRAIHFDVKMISEGELFDIFQIV